MGLRQSVSTASTIQTAHHTLAPAVPVSHSSQSSHVHNPALHASLKVAGVLVFITLCALIILSAQASGKQANDEFNYANKDSVSSLSLDAASQSGATADGSQSNSGSNISASVQAGSDSNGTSVNVSVNGEDMTVPPNGSLHKTVTDDGGTTTVNVNTSTQGEANNRSTTRTTLNVRSHSSSSSSTSTKTTMSGTSTGGSN